jgi:NDP-sugar pyrophosphorylase family protein
MVNTMNESVSLRNITAVILAGGKGTRLQAAVSDRPKALAEIRGRPFLAWLLDRLQAEGIVETVICTGYRAEQIEAAFGSDYQGMRLAYSRESSPLGTAGALRLALPMLRSDPVLVLNGDSVVDAALPDLLAWHRAQQAAGTLLLSPVDDARRYGRVRVDAAGQVLEFEEKSQSNEPGWINAGVYVLSQRLLNCISPSREVSLEREVFPSWVGKGLCGRRVQGRFIDIGTPESYALAAEFFSKSPRP